MDLISKHAPQASRQHRGTLLQKPSRVRARRGLPLFRRAAALFAKAAAVLLPRPRLRATSRRQIHVLIARMKSDPPGLAALLAESWLVVASLKREARWAWVYARISVLRDNQQVADPAGSPAAECKTDFPAGEWRF